MCGRFALYHGADAVATLFDLEQPAPPLPPRYNIAPGQTVPAVVQVEHRTLMMARWGLLPSWASDARIGARLINARAETLADKPAFRAAFRRRRCLLPASGFYEWRQTGTAREPVFIRRQDGRLLALAGVWELWRSPAGEAVPTCAIVTTAANEALAPIHARMPAILEPPQFGRWLAPAPAAASALAELVELLQPYPAPGLIAHPVSRRVNAPEHDAPDCIEPVPRLSL